MTEQTLKYYQKLIDDWAQNLEKPYWEPLSQLARLIEETGELSRIYNHRFGDKIKKPTEEADDLESEFGDIIFCLMCMANLEGVDLDRAIQRAVEKAQGRDKDRFPRKPVE
jgi:NTP pyrophosphatase (non-canonical NTP hydrolase)